MTIGYGDVTPHSKAGKFIGALMVTLGLIVFTVFFSELYDIVQAEKMGADKTLLMRLEELNEVIEADDDGTVSESEYILFNLRKMGKVRRRTHAHAHARPLRPYECAGDDMYVLIHEYTSQYIQVSVEQLLARSCNLDLQL